MDTLHAEIEQGLGQLPAIDIHTHLVGGKLEAQGLHDLFLMVIRVLYASDSRSVAPDRISRLVRIEEAIPYLKYIQNIRLEWAFFTRCQWGEFDTALYELERYWDQLPGSPSPIGSGRLKYVGFFSDAYCLVWM